MQPLEPPPADPQLSGLGMPMSLVPMVDALRLEVNWCAESEDEARAWLQALQTLRATRWSSTRRRCSARSC